MNKFFIINHFIMKNWERKDSNLLGLSKRKMFLGMIPQ